MEPPRTPHASPLPSYASRTGYLPTRAPPMADALNAIWRWLWPARRSPPLSEQVAEQRVIDRLVEEIAEAEPETSLQGETTNPSETSPKPKRKRR